MNVDFSQAIEQLEWMLNEGILLIPNLIIAALVFLGFYMIAKLARDLTRRLSQSYGHHINLAVVLGRIVRWSVMLLGLLISIVIVVPNISPAQLFQLLGISSVALGFAFRDILQNFFAGILLLVTEPFRIGDQIIVDHYEGTVETIESRATIIKTYDGRRVVIPNTQLFTSPVTVQTAFEVRRVQYDLGIGYDEDIERVKGLILETIRHVEDVIDEPPPEVIVVGLGDFSVILRVRWWIRPALRSEAVDTRNTVLAALKAELMAQDIDMPFPTQHVFVSRTDTRDSSSML
ncbi:MAG: mechanosensitive ion channel [Chloroflexi bacterium]|jgi:small-conductance mechanosensitive channel|nr:mechanosensitive ion channel [Chloroflexota bacterium]